jgi:hypothetical protein
MICEQRHSNGDERGPEQWETNKTTNASFQIAPHTFVSRAIRNY